MPTLEWIGKDKVVNHHLDVPYRVLERQYSFDENGKHDADNGSENMIIHGDNLEALKSLLPQYEGRVKCIYIDPPYNTGNEGWVYNDNVNDPRIREWLNKTVGKEGEDLSRHDKWLCMMYPRLKLLQKLLAEDGAIFINADDTEAFSLKLLCDEIFGCSNFLVDAIWQHSIQPKGYLGTFSLHHNHTLIYRKTDMFALGSLERTAEDNKAYRNPDNDPRGPWRSGDVRNALYRPNLIYDIVSPAGNVIKAPEKGWRWSKETLTEKMKTGEIIFNSDETWIIRKIYLDAVEGRAPESIWFGKDVGTTREANSELKSIFNGTAPFDTPKPSRLIERILQVAAVQDGDIILDSFAGSGTTAHAVLNMNKADGGHRKFILIEMMDYADSITAERVKRVISGYTADKEEILYDAEITVKNLARGEEMLNEAKAIATSAKGKYSSVRAPKIENGHLTVTAVTKAADQVAGTGGSFSYYELGESLMIGDVLNENVGVEKIREYVYFTDTKSRLPEPHPDEPYFMGVHVNSAYYFYYEREAVTTLNRKFLHTIKTQADAYVIYADLCTLSDAELEKYHITFKKIPRDITKL